MTEQQLLEATKILNEPGMTWKVRRALLIYKVGLSEELAEKLMPEPDGEFHPGDY